MKKTNHIFLISVLGFAAAFSFLSCQEPIYNTINKEVALEDSTIQGDINSIVRFGSITGVTAVDDNSYTYPKYLYLENGNIYYKTGEPSNVYYPTTGSYSAQWTKDSNAPDGTCVKVAADATYVYAYVVTYEEDLDDDSDTEGDNIIDTQKLYCTTGPGASWEEITLPYTIETLFCTNSTTESYRSAYVRLSDGNTYALDGTTEPTTALSESDYDGLDADEAVAAVNETGTVHFSNYMALAEDTDGNLYFRDSSTGDHLYYGTSIASPTGYSDLDCGTIFSLSLTSDYILIGTSDGIAKAAIASGVPADDTTDFSTNAESELSSSYYVYLVFALNPALTESDNDMYGTTVYYGSASASSSVYDNHCLWAYYPGRGNWNRE